MFSMLSATARPVSLFQSHSLELSSFMERVHPAPAKNPYTYQPSAMFIPTFVPASSAFASRASQEATSSSEKMFES